MHVPARAMAVLVVLCGCASTGDHISAWEAADHLAEHNRVCGRVVSTRYETVSGHATFLDLERPYPDQPFSVVISARLRESFVDRPERFFLDTDVCVTGVIRLGGVPRIVVTDLGQIRQQ